MLSHHLLWLNKPLIITKNCISLEGISPLWHPSSLASAQSRVKKRGREGERDGEHITLYYWAMHLVSDGGVICVKKVALFSADPHISAGTTWVGTLLRNLCAWKWQHHCAFALFSDHVFVWVHCDGILGSSPLLAWSFQHLVSEQSVSLQLHITLLSFLSYFSFLYSSSSLPLSK